MRPEFYTNLMSNLKRRVQLMITRGVVSLVDSTTAMQIVQIKSLGGITIEQAEQWESYGFTAKSHVGSEALMAAVGGRVGQPVAISVADRRYRLKGLESGEVAIYDDLGQKIVLHRDRIEITTPKLIINAADEAIINTKKFVVNAVDKATINTKELNFNASEKMVMTSPQVEVNAVIDITANTPIISVPSGDVDASSISLVSHVHSGDSGGTTSTPQ